MAFGPLSLKRAGKQLDKNDPTKTELKLVEAIAQKPRKRLRFSRLAISS